jgi:hypothetical protein
LDAVVLMKTFEAAAMEAAERQGFAVVMYGDLLSLPWVSTSLYRPREALGSPQYRTYDLGEP